MSRLLGRTILVVDDERYITTTLSLKLRQCGAIVVTAHDGKEGYQLACRQVPDLVCTGFDMPLMHGLDLAIKLRATPITSSIPIVMLTARGHRIDVNDLLPTNVRAILGKPFSAREVLSKLEEVAWASEAAA